MMLLLYLIACVAIPHIFRRDRAWAQAEAYLARDRRLPPCHPEGDLNSLVRVVAAQDRLGLFVIDPCGHATCVHLGSEDARELGELLIAQSGVLRERIEQTTLEDLMGWVGGSDKRRIT
jgi:hypothetical protein